MTGAADGLTMIDCRWLGRGGPGRVTELLLRGLAADPPVGRWALWGAVSDDLRWPAAEVLPSRHDPHAWYGQRDVGSVPRAERAIWCHQYRPLRRSASVEVGIIYDTIPLRWGRGGAVGHAQRAYLRRVASLSDRLLTVSEFSARSLRDDLGVPPDSIDVVRLPTDVESVARVLRIRNEIPVRPHVLFVGRFAPHKNLDRLVAAFPGTAFAAGGGRLVVVGGSDAEVAALRARADRSIDVRPRCSQEELEQLLGTAAALVQPSLEEGYGLPVAEALSAGIPVAAAHAGALPEVAAGRACLFDPYDVAVMASAIDRAVAMEEHPPAPAVPVDEPVRFAAAVLRSLDRAGPVKGNPATPG